MVILENEQLAVTISEKGAELQSIQHKKANFDYLWQGAPGYWSKHAPNLFPIVGRLNESKYQKDGEFYEMNQPGFARDLVFEKGKVTEDEAVFLLHDSEETQRRYPYQFTLMIGYRLEGNRVTVTYRVENHSDGVMPYSLGGHPAFNLPLNGEGSYEDYRITLQPKPVNLAYYEMDPPPYMSGRKLPLAALHEGEIPIRRELFGAGLVIDVEGAVEQVTLSSPKAKHGVTLHIREFPYLCLWTEEGVEAPFICVEPFHGMADEAGKAGSLEEKRGINLLSAKESREHRFTLELF